MKQPKEYAKELVENMSVIHYVNLANVESKGLPVSMYKSQVIQCSLNAIDAIIENNRILLDGIRYHEELNYWEQVKTEIINLK